MSYFVVDQLEPKSPAEGVEMRIIEGEKMTMVFFQLAPDAEIPEHSHPHEQMGTVLEGSIEFVLDGERQVVEKGQAYHVPSNAVHNGRCLTDPAVVLEVFSPPREDLTGS
jgi:quercetin dioxygenase-like cupin family protein